MSRTGNRTGLAIDPDFTELLAVFPPLQFADPPVQREEFAKVDQPEPSWPDDVVRTARTISDGEVEVPVRTCTSVAAGPDSPVVVWIHGGGYCVGTAEEDEPLCAWLAARLGAVVVSVDYRLAPEHPYPAGLDDCCAVVRAVAREHPGSRIAVAGASAGAGLAAAVTLRAREGRCPMPHAQVLLMPFLDARMRGGSMRSIADAPVFDAVDAGHCWAHYLGDRVAAPPADGSPSEAQDLTGLPPAYVAVAGVDCLRDEGIDYALRLQAAGIPTELHVVPGVPHGFTGLVPTATASRRVRAEMAAVIASMLTEEENT